MTHEKEDHDRLMVCSPIENLSKTQLANSSIYQCTRCGCNVGVAPSSLPLIEEGVDPICHHCVVQGEGTFAFPRKEQILSLIEQTPPEMLQRLFLVLAHWEKAGPALLEAMLGNKEARH